MTLARKMTLLISLVATTAAIVLSVVISLLVQHPVQSVVRAHQVDAAHQIMGSIDYALYERSNDLAAIGKDTALVNVTQAPGNAAAVQAAMARLTQLAAVNSVWSQFEVIGQGDTVLASTDASRVGKTIAADSASKSLLKQASAGNIAAADPAVEPNSGKIIMLFAAPLQDSAHNQTVGVVVGHLTWDTVLSVITGPGAATTHLYNAKGTELATKAAPNVSKDVASAVVQRALQDQQGTLIVPPSGGQQQKLLMAFVREQGAQTYKGNGWVLTTETPTSQAFAAGNRTTLEIVVSLVLIVMVSAVAAILLIVRAIGPVGSLTAVTQKIASGDLTQRVKVTSHNEYGQLAASFNAMADKLQQVYEGLERKVVEKTAQLAQKVREVEAEKVKDEALLSSIGEGMVAIDADGRVVKVNQPAAATLGVGADKLNGQKITELVTFHDDQGQAVPPESQPGFLALHHGQKTEEVYQLSRADNPKVAVSVTSSPVRLEGRTIGVIMVIRDVTKEREVDRMKTEFISLASHQLRTPLSAIRWFSEMLISGDAGELQAEQKEFAQNISDSTDRMIQLVSSLLNISRIESGRIIIDPKPTDMQKLVSGIVSDLHAKIDERQQNLAISIHDGLDNINLDPRLIGQVYLNLLTNAIKYTPKGGDITVLVSKKGDEIISQVSDNGYGIPKDQQDKMFQKFFRADNVAKVETDGTGLGMYLVKAIVESSGGKIWFQSEEGKGTTFWFSLPAAGMKAKAGEVSLDS